MREKHSIHTRMSVMGTLRKALRGTPAVSWLSGIQVSGSISLISTNLSFRIFSTNFCGSRDAGEYVAERVSCGCGVLAPVLGGW